MVENAADILLDLEEMLADRLEQGLVAACANLHEPVGDLRATEGDPAGRLRILETHQTGLGKRVDSDDGCAALLRLLES